MMIEVHLSSFWFSNVIIGEWPTGELNFKETVDHLFYTTIQNKTLVLYTLHEYKF